MATPKRCSAALPSDPTQDRRPKKKAAVDRWSDRRGANEKLAKAFNHQASTVATSRPFHFAVFEHGLFVGISSAPSLAAARAILIKRGVT